MDNDILKKDKGEKQMKISDNVAMLELKTDRGKLSLSLIWDDENVILVDAGFPNLIDRIEEEMGKVGLKVADITGVVITHQDFDHIGSIDEVLKAAPGAKLYAHEDEVRYIDGTEDPIKLKKMETEYDTLPKERQDWYHVMKAGIAARRFKIDNVLRDGNELPVAGGVRVIHTPGHTPGHISLYVEKD